MLLVLLVKEIVIVAINRQNSVSVVANNKKGREREKERKEYNFDHISSLLCLCVFVEFVIVDV